MVEDAVTDSVGAEESAVGAETVSVEAEAASADDDAAEDDAAADEAAAEADEEAAELEALPAEELLPHPAKSDAAIATLSIAVSALRLLLIIMSSLFLLRLSAVAFFDR